METETEGRILEELKAALKEYDKIFLVRGSGGVFDELLTALCGSQTVRTGKQKLLILSASPETAGETGAVWRQVTEAEARFLDRLYHMYEFSDRFSVVSRSSLYGGLFQLMDTGLLSSEEAAEALLC